MNKTIPYLNTAIHYDDEEEIQPLLQLPKKHVQAIRIAVQEYFNFTKKLESRLETLMKAKNDLPLHKSFLDGHMETYWSTKESTRERLEILDKALKKFPKK